MKNKLHIALLTGGGDRPYALGIADSLSRQGCKIDFIGSDELKSKLLDEDLNITFLNLRGDQDPNVSSLRKVIRLANYYCKLIWYALKAKPRIFHILWNNKIQLVDRVFLMCYYRLLGKKIFHTVHNVNIGKRDGSDSFLNRLTLKFQYKNCHTLFVHTKRMKDELITEFCIEEEKIKQIPFGLNATVPNSSLESMNAKRELGLDTHNKTILFFGNILAYKGVDYLVEAFIELANEDPSYRLIIAGRSKGDPQYWNVISKKIDSSLHLGKVIRRIEFIPDEDTELYFKAADILALPYTSIFQSGVLFLSYNFGLPVVATKVGSLADDVLVGETGFTSEPYSSEALASSFKQYFSSDLYRSLDHNRSKIVKFAKEKYSWETVGEITVCSYQES